MDEIVADVELVEEPERDRQIGVEVDAVPRLVGETAASGLDRADRDDYEDATADERHQHVRIGRDERPELDHDVAPVAQGVADGDEQSVGKEEPRAREAEPAMRPGETVHPEDLVEPRAA